MTTHKKPMPRAHELREVYEDESLDVRRYIDLYIQLGGHLEALFTVKLKLNKQAVDRAQRLGVSIVYLQIAASNHIRTASYLDMVKNGVSPDVAIDEVLCVHNEMGLNVQRYCRLRAGFSFSDAVYLLANILPHSRTQNFWGEEAKLDDAMCVKLGKKGVSVSDVASLVTDELFRDDWLKYGDQLYYNNASLQEFRDFAAAGGDISGYMYTNIKQGLKERGLQLPLSELAMASHLWDYGIYLSHRKRGLSSEDAVRKVHEREQEWRAECERESVST